MLWIYKRIAMGNIKLVVINIMQKHIDTAKIISCNIDFLSKKSLTHIFFAKNFGKFKQQRSTATRGVSKVSVFDTIER